MLRLFPVMLRRSPSTMSAFAYPTAEQVSLASLESVAVLDKRVSSQVLEDISFSVEPGQMVALVGPSGAGKTTITNLVARLYDVTGGSVRVGGHDVREVTLQSLHDTIGYVTQDAHMFHDTHPGEPCLREARRHGRGDDRGAPVRAGVGSGLVPA